MTRKIARLVIALITSAALVDCAKSSEAPAGIRAPAGESSPSAAPVCNDCAYTDSCKRIVNVERVRAPAGSAPDQLCCAPIPMLKQRSSRIDQGLATQCDTEERRAHHQRRALEEAAP